MTRSFKNLKICLITNYFKSVGGISGQVEILKDNLVREGAKVEIFSTKVSNFLRPFILLKLLKDCKKFDIIHIHGCSYWGGFFPIMVGTIAGKILRKKIIITYHGGGAESFFENHRIITQYSLNLADIITVPSGFLKDVFYRFGFKVEIIPNILDLSQFKYIKRKAIKPKLIVTRTLSEIYSVESVIYAFEIVKKQFPNAELKIVGDGPLRKDLELLVRKLNLSKVKFTGRIRNNQMNKMLCSSDIFINPTTEDNMPVSVLEAFACGLPVVSTDVGGLPYLIKNGITGLLMKPKYPKIMAKKIIRLIRNQKYAFKLTKNARKYVEKYKWNSIKDQWLNIYKNE